MIRLSFLSQRLPEENDAIGTGEDDPVVAFQPRDGLVEFFPRKGWDDLNGGKLNDLCF